MSIRARIVIVAGVALIGASPVLIDHLEQWESGGSSLRVDRCGLHGRIFPLVTGFSKGVM